MTGDVTWARGPADAFQDRSDGVWRVLRWEEPAPPKHPVGRRYRESALTAVAAELMDHPGEWGVIYDGRNRALAGGLAHRITQGQPKCFSPAGLFDAVFRSVGDSYVTFARYVGDGGG
jgi:hypothetical protein